MSRSRFLPIIAIALLAQAANAGAQEAAAPGVSSLRSNPVAGETGPALRVQLVIARFQGEKKLSSIPYTFVIAPNNPTANMTRIRMGVDVPLPLPEGSVPGSAPQYRNIGTNVDCYNVRELSGGRYQFDINMQTTAAVPEPDGGAKNSPPLVRKFDSNFSSVLRDGQSMQAIASTDPVTGEVIKVDVTLNVLR